jgi:serine/threonine protein kinase
MSTPTSPLASSSASHSSDHTSDLSTPSSRETHRIFLQDVGQAVRAVKSIYKIHAQLGSGAYGVVLAVSPKTENSAVPTAALKVMTNDSALREVRGAMCTSHPNIVPFTRMVYASNGMCACEMPLYTTTLHVAMSHLGDDELFTMNQVGWIFCCVAQGLAAAAAAGFSNRDLKPENILMRKKGKHIAIADWGLAKDQLDTRPTGCLTPEVITVWYAPPEVLAGLDYGASVDIWSLGVILLQLLIGSMFLRTTTINRDTFTEEAIVPLLDVSTLTPADVAALQECRVAAHRTAAKKAAHEAARAGKRGSSPPPLKPLTGSREKCWRNLVIEKRAVVSHHVLDLLETMLAPDPKRRPTITQILDSVFVKDSIARGYQPIKLKVRKQNAMDRPQFPRSPDPVPSILESMVPKVVHETNLQSPLGFNTTMKSCQLLGLWKDLFAAAAKNRSGTMSGVDLKTVWLLAAASSHALPKDKLCDVDAILFLLHLVYWTHGKSTLEFIPGTMGMMTQKKLDAGVMKILAGMGGTLPQIHPFVWETVTSPKIDWDVKTYLCRLVCLGEELTGVPVSTLQAACELAVTRAKQPVPDKLVSSLLAANA